MTAQTKPIPAKLLSHPAALCNMVRRVAYQAGEITLQYFDDAGYHGADAKGDGSPVTIADREAERYIEPELEKLTPGVPMIGEESASEGRKVDLTGHEYFWLVDPLDGTKEFISGSGDYTVNIALIYKGAPILGVVYAPVKGEMYAGYSDPATGEKKAVRWMDDSEKEKEIRVRGWPKEGLTVVASKSHGDTKRLDQFLSNFKVEKMIKRGSSLKICAVAAGKADLYPRFGPTCEWDTAAGDAVLRAAGGVIIDLQGQKFIYGQGREKYLNPEFIAAGEVILQDAELLNF